MMKQYQEAKRACPEALLLFRMGDFDEMFHDDVGEPSELAFLTSYNRISCRYSRIIEL
jgi:DNA mismatch repair protein MutS